MTETTSAAERGRESAAPAATLYETAVIPTSAINPTTTTQGLTFMINNTQDFLAFGKANLPSARRISTLSTHPAKSGWLVFRI